MVLWATAAGFLHGYSVMRMLLDEVPVKYVRTVLYCPTFCSCVTVLWIVLSIVNSMTCVQQVLPISLLWVCAAH